MSEPIEAHPKWLKDFFKALPDGAGWNNTLNHIVNKQFKDGLKPEEAAREFTRQEM